MVTAAARKSGVDRKTWYNLRRADPAFAQEWDDAIVLGVEALEDEVIRRGRYGVTRSVYYRGKAVGEIREFSDALLMFGLKGRKPEMYRDNYKIEHSGPGGRPIETVAATIAIEPGNAEEAAADFQQFRESLGV